MVQIAQVHCNQATKSFAAPLGHGVKSTGTEPGGTARMYQYTKKPNVATTLLTWGQWNSLQKDILFLGHGHWLTAFV